MTPAYLMFAFSLVALSALSTKVFGWRTAPNGAWKLRDLEWPLLDWVRYMVGINVEAGEKTQIGAMSAVLKGTKLEAFLDA